MIPPLDPFALNFDSIEIDPTRAPTPAAIEHALALCAPQDALLTASAAAPDLERAGFYLADDAGGRFTVDRHMGVIALKDETLLAREHGMVHAVRLRVVEPSGASYKLDLQLRLTGRVPQVVGAEEFGAIATMAADIVVGAPPASTTVVATPQAQISWTRYAAALAAPGKAALIRTRRAFIGAELPTGASSATLTIAEPLPPVGVLALWSH